MDTITIRRHDLGSAIGEMAARYGDACADYVSASHNPGGPAMARAARAMTRRMKALHRLVTALTDCAQ